MKDSQSFGETLKLPPQNIEAEQAVLGGMLLDNGVIPEIKTMLVEENFYRTAHQHIFSAIMGICKRGEAVDLLTLSNELKKRKELEEIGGASYIAKLFEETPTTENIKHYAAIVKEKAVLRKAIEAANELLVTAYGDGVESKEILATFQRRIFGLLDLTENEAVEKLEISPDNLTAHFSSSRETPFEELNRAIGGFFGGELIIIGGRGGMGKTALAMEFIKHTALKEKYPVIYFGAEMLKEVIYARLLCSLCDVPYNDFKRRRLDDRQTKRLSAGHKEINQSQIHYLIIKEKLDAGSLLAQAKQAHGTIGEPGLIVVENFQQLSWPEKLKSEKQEYDCIAIALKTLAIELSAPVVLSSQLGRQVDQREDKRPLPSDLKETGKLEELADKILLIYRDNYYTKLSGSPEDAELIVAKGGTPTTLYLKFHGDFLSWRE